MTSATQAGTTVKVFQVFIKATPQAIWDAITKPEWTEKYGYGGNVEYDLRPGGAFRSLASEAMKAHGAPEVVVEGEVVEADPPRRLVQTWRLAMGPDTEPFTRVTWETEEGGRPGVTKLTVTHDLEGAPRTAAMVSGEMTDAGGGWSWVLSDMKTLLETGTSLTG